MTFWTDVITDISFLEKLTKLETLLLAENQFTDISSLKNLTQLQYLDLSFNQIKDISSLRKLTQLQGLSLENNQIQKTYSLGKLIQLRELDLRDNLITDISFLENLTQLQRLDLYKNKITDIQILEKLTDLQTLDLSNNHIKDITPLIPLIKKSGIEVTLEISASGLNLYDNPITTPPLEIVRQGRDAILDWFEANKEELKEIKIILIGEAKAGKTSLLKRFENDSFNDKEEQTDGVNIVDIDFAKNKQFQDQISIHPLTGHFWDFGGQEIMSATHQFFLTNRSVYILILDARKDNLVAEQIRKWIQRIRATGGDSPILVVANQIDVNPGFGFENENELKTEFPQIKGFLKISCATEEGLAQMKHQLARVIPQAELFHTKIDEQWIKLISELRKESNGKYLSEHQFNKICTNLPEKRQKENAIKFFHDLGLILHFKGIKQNLSEYFILDPYWITYGVYQILTSSLAASCKGKVPITELEYIINEEKDKIKAYQPANYERIQYSTNERRFLVDILHEFKLCYYLSDGSHFIIPDLLDTREPIEITELIRRNKNAIRLVYEYDFLPKSIIPQIMVWEHDHLQAIWRTGCVISTSDSQALISSYQNKLSVTIVGQHKKAREQMAVIRHLLLNIIHKNSPIKPEMIVPLPDSENLFVSYEELIERERDGEKKYTIYKPSKKSFEISQLLEGIPDQNEMMEIVNGIKQTVDHISDKQDQILVKINYYFPYMIEQIEDKSFEREVLQTIKTITHLQAESIKADLITIISTAFELHQDDLNEELISIKNTFDSTDITQLKLKLGLPLLSLLGIGIEAEFDLKGWYKKMYKKHELNIFKVMGML